MFKKEKREKKEKLVEKKKKHKKVQEEDDEITATSLNKAQEGVKSEEEKRADNDEEEHEEQDAETKTDKIKLYMVDFNECDPKKCSGRKLENFGLLKSINHKSRFKGITLSAGGKKPISKEDTEIVLKYGLCVIDCSWNKIQNLVVKTKFDHERILPFMVAVNPINFGAPYKLSCAEALAAGLFICDFWEQGHGLMEKFKWGPGFHNLNKEIFDLYQDCKTVADLGNAEQKYLAEARKAENKPRQRSLPPSSSESEDEPVYIPKDEEDEDDHPDDKAKEDDKQKE